MINLSIGAFVLIVIGGCMLVCLLWMTIIIDELRKTVKDIPSIKLGGSHEALKDVSVDDVINGYYEKNGQPMHDLVHRNPEQKFRGEF